MHATGHLDAKPLDPTRRFSNRVVDYVRYRPHYPDTLQRTLRDRAGLWPGSVVADVGSGTGISSRMFLDLGCTVHAVEPNADMRRAAEQWLGGRHSFHSVDARAEDTTLPEASVDLIAAGQAFHWFDPVKAKKQFARILKPGGHVALFWNTRRTGGTAFMRAYEALLKRFGTDYQQVPRSPSSLGLDGLFDQPCERHVFDHHQMLDLTSLRGRLLSSSYSPAEGHPNHIPMLAELERMFRTHAENGSVRIEYDTELYVGCFERP